MYLPAKDPRIAKWLFGTYKTNFHPDCPLLSPAAFESALAVQVTHLFTKFSPLCLFTLDYSTSHNIRPSSAFIDVLQVQVTEVDGVILGYCFTVDFEATTHHPYTLDACHGADRCGRFAYDPVSDQAIIVMEAVDPTVLDVLTFHNVSAPTRSRIFYLIPRAPYSHENLPSNVLAMMDSSERRISVPCKRTRPLVSSSSSTPDSYTEPSSYPSSHASFSPSISQSISESVSPSFLHSTVAEQKDLFSPIVQEHQLQAQAPYINEPFPFLQQQQQLSTLPLVPSSGAQNSAFDMSPLSRSLEGFELSLSGEFYGPHVTRHVIDPVTGTTTRATGILKSLIRRASGRDRLWMRQLAAQKYYACAFPLNSESRLSLTGADEPQEVNAENGSSHAPIEAVSVMKRPRVRSEKPVLPRLPDGVSKEAYLEIVSEKQSPVDEEAAKKAKVDAKRRKNRMSAARSNEKRKERLELQRRELELLKAKRVELIKVQQHLKNENDILKMLAKPRG